MDLLKKIQEMDEEKRLKFYSKIEKEGDKYGIYPVTRDQYLLWCGYCTGSNKIHFSNPGIIVRLKNIKRERLLRIIDELRKMQDTLRYRFFESDGRVYQYIISESEYKIYEEDISDQPDAESTEIMDKKWSEFAALPIDIVNEATSNIKIIRFAEDSFYLFICMHHIVSDALSVGAVFKNLCAIIEGTAVKSKYQFGHYALLKNTETEKEKEKRNIDYWINEINDVDKFLDLPVDHPRDSDRPDYVKHTFELIDGEFYSSLKAKTVAMGINMYNLMASVFSIVIKAYAQKKDAIIATTFFNRSDDRFSGIAGDFATIVPLVFRTDDEMTLNEYIESCMNNFRTALGKSDITITTVQEAFPYERREGAFPLYQTTFVYHSHGLIGDSVKKINGTEIELIEIPEEKQQGHYSLDICGEVIDRGSNCTLFLHYCNKLFDKRSIENIMRVMMRLLRNIDGLSDVKLKDLSLADPADFENITEVSGDPQEPYRPVEFIPPSYAALKYGSSRISILNDYGKAVPVNFFGYIYLEKDGKWFATGKKGKIDLDSELKIDEKHSSIVSCKGSNVDLEAAAEKLRDVYPGILVTFRYTEQCRLILNYSGIDGELSMKEVNSLIGFEPDMVFKTEFPNRKGIQNHQDNAFKADQILREKNYTTDIIQDTVSNSVNVIIVGDRAAANSEIAEIDNILCDDSIIFRFSDTHISDNEDIKELYTYPKKLKSRTENIITSIWEEVLGNSDFSIYDHFYEVGGNSVKVISLWNKLKQFFELDIKVTDLFIHNTVFEQGRFIDELKQEHYEEAQAEVLEF